MSTSIRRALLSRIQPLITALAVMAIALLAAGLTIVVPAGTAQAQAVADSSPSPGISDSLIDSVGLVGLGLSMVLDDNDFPVVAYMVEASSNGRGIQVVRCNDTRCTGGDESIVKVPGVGQTSIVLDPQGFPVVLSATGLVRCTSTTCADGAYVSTPKGRSVQTNRSLALDANGNPIIAYRTDPGITIEHCNDPLCVGGDESISTPHAVNTGFNAVMTLDAASNPVVVYQDRRNGDLQLMHCDDPGCVGTESIERVGESPYFPELVPGLVLDDDGNPAVYFTYLVGGGGFIVRCDDPSCAPGGDTTTLIPGVGSPVVPNDATLRLDSEDRPVIAYRTFEGSLGGENRLALTRCADRFCADGATTTTIAPGNLAVHSAFQLDSEDRPVIAYQAPARSSVRLARCGDPECSPAADPTEQVEVMHVTSCLDQNGRIDTNIVNRGADAATYRLEFEGLSPRENTVAAKDWWRMPVTGRPDQPYTIVVKRNGVVVSNQTVTVTCDQPVPSLDDPVVRVISSCRLGLGYILFQFVNPSPNIRPFVITFDGVPNRSTSAGAYGQALRSVTGRPAGSYQATITSNGQSVGIYTVDVDC